VFVLRLANRNRFAVQARVAVRRLVGAAGGRRVVLAHGSTVLRSSRVRMVRLRLSRPGRALVRRRGAVRAKVILVVRNPSGESRSAKKTLTLRLTGVGR
jgi:hypothetical protein